MTTNGLRDGQETDSHRDLIVLDELMSLDLQQLLLVIEHFGSPQLTMSLKDIAPG